MKPARIWLLIVLLAALGSPANGQAPAQQGEPVTKATGLSEPEQVVRDYFQAYIAWLEYGLKKKEETAAPLKPVPDRTLDPSLVTKHYIDSYRRLMAEDQKTTPPGMVGFLDHDPILCAQDWPDNMAQAAIVAVKNTGTEALVKVNLFPGQKPVQPQTVKLKKLPAGWRIDAILCGKDDFDSLYKKMQEWYKKQKK